MSDVMLFGVLRMPYEQAMGDDISRLQFYNCAQEAADRIEELERKNERLQEDEMILDIDFRVISRKTDATVVIDGIGYPHVKNVMQWRKKIHMPLPDQPELPPGVPPLLKPEPEWTEWQDVRAEVE